MSNTYVLTNEDNLKDIADAIRTQNGTNEAYTPSEMAPAILSLKAGGVGELSENLAYIAEEGGNVVTLTNKSGSPVAPRTSASLVSLQDGRTVEEAMPYVTVVNADTDIEALAATLPDGAIIMVRKA